MVTFAQPQLGSHGQTLNATGQQTGRGRHGRPRRPSPATAPTGADTGAQQQFGKILRAGIRRRGQRRVQPEIDVAGVHIA
jgi:hypothetical protein